MMQLLKGVWEGWRIYTEEGKLAALLLISLLFLWLYYKKAAQETFLIYTTAAAVCCIFPVTAAGLTLYQTKFYDYVWIWSLVPTVAMIGYGAAIFVTDVLREAAGGDKRKAGAAVALLLVIAFLCGGMGTKPWDDTEERAQRAEVEMLLPQIRERMADGEIVLWAPREILEYVREYDPRIKLLYGRNMWEDSLNAYVYGGYSQEMRNLYQWTDWLKWAKWKVKKEPISAQDCAEILAGTDVNCILLPEDTAEEAVRRFEETLRLRRESLEGYYLLVR